MAPARGAGMIAAFVAVMALSLLIALWARRGAGQGPRAFFVAGGQLGAILFFFLSVGETYSIATMLGFPGGVYAGGEGFVVWFFGYILLAAPVLAVLGPWIWRAGNLYGAVTIPDFFAAHFNSRLLERVIALGAIALLVPIGTMQFAGIRLVLGALAPSLPMPLLLAGAGLVVMAYVALAGLRAAAFVAVLKDALMLGAILLVGALALRHWPGAAAPVATATVAAQVPVTLPFALSTIAVQALGFAMIPQNWAFLFAARGPQAIVRAQAAAPLYMVMFPLLMAVAVFARRLGLPVDKPDFVFLAAAQHLLPGWALGVVMAAVVLAGMVILSSVCLAIAPLLTRNVLPGLDGRAQQRWAQGVTALFIALSAAGAMAQVPLLAMLNTVFYFGIVQTLPGFLAALWTGRVRAGGVLAGMAVAALAIIGMRLAGISAGGINPGLVGLILNSVVLTLVTLMFPRRDGHSVMAMLR
ncbi:MULTISPECIES: sodium:solute symporter [unclassified Novosphingobium]|uniref:sodium:solute symporter family protein n=2 Tax=unclassified Novosphingobium TaxID=2644732 RepID=UPI001494B01A|nr:SSS family solute:Na+ symporter [Novosphingobium sp. BK280]MBB3501939.1 SSS family solute:Na+ symporter [Novosphingobium sp. BK336]